MNVAFPMNKNISILSNSFASGDTAATVRAWLETQMQANPQARVIHTEIWVGWDAATSRPTQLHLLAWIQRSDEYPNLHAKTVS